jgi:hypothetical protein
VSDQTPEIIDETPEEKIERRRAARKASVDEKRSAQRVIDLEALDALETQLGDANVGVIELDDFIPGLVTLVAYRVPRPAEVNRYRDRVKPSKKGEPPDFVVATEELAAVVTVYPDRKTEEGAALLAKLFEERPAVKSQIGQAASKKSLGREVGEGKG